MADGATLNLTGPAPRGCWIDHLLLANGVGDTKVARYGAAVLKVVRENGSEPAEGRRSTTVEFARDLRSDPSLPERMMWGRLRDRVDSNRRVRRRAVLSGQTGCLPLFLPL